MDEWTYRRSELARMFGKWPWEVDELPYRYYHRLWSYYQEMNKREAEAIERAKEANDPYAHVDWDAERVVAPRDD